MKKLISIIMSSFIILSCFCITVFAEDLDYNNFQASERIYGGVELDKDYTVKLSEDFHTLYVDENTLVPVDASKLDYDYYWVKTEGFGATMDFELTEQQKKDIKEIKVACTGGLMILELHIELNNGAVYKLSYIQQEYYDDYEKVIAGVGDQVVVDFEYPQDNMISADKADFYTEPIIIFDVGIRDITWYNVSLASGPVQKPVGAICVGDQGKYYFCDSAENGKDGAWRDDYYGDFAQLKVHEITDPQVIAEIDQGLRAFYSDDYGSLYDEEKNADISTLLVTVLFLLVPLAVLVIFTVKAVKAKGTYRKLYTVISIGALVEIIIFIILVVILN